MNNFLYQLSLYSVYVPLLSGIILFKKIDKFYYPFLLLLFANTVNELIRSFLMGLDSDLQLTANIFCLLEAIIITWIFRQWHLLENRKTYRWLLFFYILVWLAENSTHGLINHPQKAFTFHSIGHGFSYHFNWYFNVLYSFIAVLQSIAMINKLANIKTTGFHLHPVFFICTSFIVLYSFAIIHTMFLLPFLSTSSIFRLQIWDMLSIVYILTYLIYAYAILLMAKQKVPHIGYQVALLKN